MKKPDKIIIELANLGWIRGIQVDYQQTGTESATTFCTITGSNGICEGVWETYERYLIVKVGHCYVAELGYGYKKDIEDWNEFEKKNKLELAEYERLKAKFT